MTPRVLVALLVGFSGLCGLGYQIVWDRLLRASFGGDTTSSAVVAGTFLLGLGLGALIFGRRWRRPFRVYALVEAGIGVFAIFGHHLLGPLALHLGGLLQTPLEGIEGLRLSVVVGATSLLLLPCILIGGTLPLIFHCFIAAGSTDSRELGRTYGLNTAGAGLGALLVPLLLGRLAVSTALALLGSGNLLLAGAILIYGHATGRRVQASSAPEETTPSSPPRRQHLVLAFVSGAILLVCEVSLFRALAVVNPSSAYNFTLVLTPLLLATALGAMRFSRFRLFEPDRALQRIGLLLALCVVALVVGICLAAGLHHLRVRWLSAAWGGWLMALYGLVLALPLPYLLGGVFPLILRLAAPRAGALPASTGRVYLANALGAFAGAMVAHFVGFALLGTRGTLTVVVAIGLAAGCWCLWQTLPARRRVLVVVGAGLALALTAMVPNVVWQTYIFGRRVVTHAPQQLDRVEGATGVATMLWTARDLGYVYVNGQMQGSITGYHEGIRHSVFARAVRDRRRALVLGLGAGSIVKDLVADAAVQRIRVVDWSHELPRLLALPRAAAVLAGALDHPEVRLYRGDARVAVTLIEAGSVDLVVDDLTLPRWVGGTHTRSLEFFARVRRVLAPGGTYVIKVNATEARQAVLAGLARTFRHVARSAHGITLCSQAPLQLDRPRLRALVGRHREAFGSGAIATAAARLEPVTAGALFAEPIRDDLLVHEFGAHPFGRLLGFAPAR